MKMMKKIAMIGLICMAGLISGCIGTYSNVEIGSKGYSIGCKPAVYVPPVIQKTYVVKEEPPKIIINRGNTGITVNNIDVVNSSYSSCYGHGYCYGHCCYGRHYHGHVNRSSTQIINSENGHVTNIVNH